MGVEWDPSTVYWSGSTRMQTVTLALMLGYLLRGIHTLGISSAFFTPAELRRFYQIPPKEKKTKEFLLRPIQMEGLPPLEHEVQTNLDVHDALLIAYAAAIFQQRAAALRETLSEVFHT